jgi:transcriptional regulator with XRE-family HTH domain
MDANALVAWNLRRLRVERRLSQEALGVDAGLDRTYIGRIERGKENPTVAVLERIAHVLDSPITALFDLPKPGATRPVPLPGGRRRAT